jgi:UDP-N-acetylglucosamine transferase subunit ALG13
MIFLTVGHQTPFDRLVRLFDTWADSSGAVVFGQIGNSGYRPKHMESTDFLSTQDFERRLDQCTAVVSHAGTGTIIQGLLRRKSILVLPRLASNGETRNDHQLGTARYFQEAGQIFAAYDDESFFRLLDDVENLPPGKGISARASDQLLDRLRRFVGEASTMAGPEGAPSASLRRESHG